MHNLKPTAASSLSLPPDSYIYSIDASGSGSFAAISSDDSLRVFDAGSLGLVSLVSAKTHDGGVTSLRTYRAGDHPLLTTAGRDGLVKLWDLRTGNSSAVGNLQMQRKVPVLSVACCPGTNSVVAGTELASSQAVVALWDIRSPSQPRLQYVESHNDDITELQYHPTNPDLVLSGSTDGLVNIYNTTITEEDDALVQVINHGSVHRAGFLSGRSIYALSHDESFSLHSATDPDDNAEEPDPVHFGDLRAPLECDYVAQLCLGSNGAFVAAGNMAEKRLDLVPLVQSPGPDWKFDFDRENLWRLPGAHGEEVVRSVYLDEQSKSVITCGEDGFVRAWKPVDEMEEEPQSEGASTKSKKQKKDRFKPY